MIIWLGFFISAGLLIYPFVIYPMILRILPSAPPLDGGGNSDVRFALLISAYNEEACIGDTLSDLERVSALWPELEIMIFNDGSSDRTAALLSTDTPSISILHGGVRIGKKQALGRMMRRTDADVLIFMDANVRVNPASLLRFRDYFANRKVGAVAAHVQVTPGVDTATAEVGARFWTLEERLKELESRTGSTMGCDGALWAIRRTLYPQFGEHESDDLRPSMEPLFKGFRVLSAPDILATEKITSDSGDEFRRKIRIACGAWHAHNGMARARKMLRPLDRFKYFSHKVIRWFSGTWAALTLMFGILILVEATGSPWIFGLVLMVAALGLPTPLLRRLTDILLAMIATQIGVVRAMSGYRETTWTPVRGGSTSTNGQAAGRQAHS